MTQSLGSRWIEDLFGPRRKALFALRIRARIVKLRFQLWWRRPKGARIRHYWQKPAALLTVGILVPVLLGWLLSQLFPREANGLLAAASNLMTDPQRSRLEWREAAQILLLLIGIPSAFLLWLFRDLNVSGTLENQRKDVNLKEFQEIQMRAAGAMDERLPAAARETLQIAALHQLRAFLRGEYGTSFRRPALELLRARLVASAQDTGIEAIRDWLNAWRTDQADHRKEYRPDHIAKMREEVAKALAAVTPTKVGRTEQQILAEEWEAIFRSGLPLGGSAFDLIVVDRNVLLADLDLADCLFVGASLARTHLERTNLAGANLAHAHLYQARMEGANLSWAQLEGAHLYRTRLQRANLGHAHLEGANLEAANLGWANLRAAYLDGANLRWSRLSGASLSGASLRGADLSGAKLDGAELYGAHIEGAIIPIGAEIPAHCGYAVFDDTTQFAARWQDLPESGKEEARGRWIARGAVRAD